MVAFRDVTGALSGRGDNPSGFELCDTSQASCRWAESRILWEQELAWPIFLRRTSKPEDGYLDGSV